MRLDLTIFICILFAISCTRSNQPLPQPNPNPGLTPDSSHPVSLSLPLLDSFKVYTLGPKEITFITGKMNYDGSGRLTDIHGASTDTTENGQPLRPDTSDFTLIYNGADSLPAAYTNSGTSSLMDHGFLSYDNQARLNEDSGSNGMTPWLYKYQYNEKQVTRSSVYSADTIIIENNNILSCRQYMNIYSFTYSAYPNPFYQPALANHVGPMMVFFNGTDIFSKNLYNSSKSQFVNNDPYLVVNYSWTTNANGQVISGIGTDAKTGAILQYLWFTYR
jgi:hypothetical protein